MAAKARSTTVPTIPDTCEWGGAQMRKASVLAARQVQNLASNALDAANALGRELSSLVRVFDITVDRGQRSARLQLTAARPGKPAASNLSGGHRPLLPKDCRELNHTYSGALMVDAVLRITDHGAPGGAQVYTDQVLNAPLGEIPVFVGSDICSTAMMTPEEREAAGESRTDPGGHLLIRGMSYALRTTESLTYNMLMIPYHNPDGTTSEVTMGTMISKPGDVYENSAQIKLRVHRDDRITVEIAYGTFAQMEVPFWLMFRLLGVANDRDIVRLIAHHDGAGPARGDVATVVEKLRRAFRALPESSEWHPTEGLFGPEEIAGYLGWSALPSMMRLKKLGEFSEDDQRAVVTTAMIMVNMHFLPHVGLTPAAFPEKARHLAVYIWRMLLVNSGIVAPSNRDDCRGKRWHSPDVALVKEFKTTLNYAVMRDLSRNLGAQLETMAPQHIRLNVLLSGLAGQSKLMGSMQRAIIEGSKLRQMGPRVVASRLDSQLIERKTNASAITDVRTVRTPNKTSKKSDRTIEIRFVQLSYWGIICPHRSADSGEQIGVTKGEALLAICSRSTSSDDLAAHMRAHPLLAPERVPGAASAEVYVNGLIVGYTRKTLFATRAALVVERRTGKMPRRTTIAADGTQSILNIWCDTGRPMAPFVVVENNDNPDGSPGAKAFAQWPLVQRAELYALLSGAASFEDLEAAGKIEYLSPEEIANSLMAESAERLWEIRDNDLFKCTHMLVSPVQLFAPSTLTSPFPENSQAQRITFQTQQRRSAISCPVSIRASYWEPSLKFMLNRHAPIVTTFGDYLFDPASANLMVGVMINNGIHSEDSVVVNRQAAERGAFACEVDVTFTRQRRRNEAFESPLARSAQSGNVSGINTNACYDYLDKNGIILVGSPVRRGTVLIGVLELLQTGAGRDLDRSTHRDASLVYTNAEEGVVCGRVLPHDTNDLQQARVKVRISRRMDIGDKMSARSGNKGICSELVDESELPFTATGERPFALYNSLSFPTRQIINQTIEAASSVVAMRQGRFVEGSALQNASAAELEEELVRDAQLRVAEAADPVLAAELLLDIFAPDGAVAVRLSERFSLSGEEVRRVFSGLGKRVMYDPHTMQPIGVAVNMALVPLQRLVHMVVDKMYAVSQPAKNGYTRQPVEGRRNDGGMRFGEMERDVLYSQGCLNMVDQKMYADSSGVRLYVCRNCDHFTTQVNPEQGHFTCPRCVDDSDVVCVASDWVTNIWAESLKAMGIDARAHVAPNEIDVPAPAGIADGSAYV